MYGRIFTYFVLTIYRKIIAYFDLLRIYGITFIHFNLLRIYVMFTYFNLLYISGKAFVYIYFLLIYERTFRSFDLLGICGS